MASRSPAKLRSLRVAAVQALFQLDAQGSEFEKEVDRFLSGQGLEEADRVFARALVDLAWSRLEKIDESIVDASQHWDLGRITPVDRAVLRLGIAEMLFAEQTPPKVAINEAIEIAKTFGTAESPQFVNGVLDAIWKKHNNQD